MRNKSQSNKLFRTWLFVQLCFFAFMFAVTIGIYFYTSYHIKQQLDALYMSGMKRTAAEVSAMFDSAVAAVNEYTMQPRLRTLAGVDLSTSEREVARLIDDIKQTNSAANGVSEIIIFFGNEGVFVSSAGVMDKDIFHEVYPDVTGKGPAKSIMDAILDDGLLGKMAPVYNGRNDTDTAIFTEKSVNDIYVSAVIDCTQIEDILAANLQSDKNVYGVFSDSALLFSLGSEMPEATWETARALESDQPYQIESADQEFVCMTSDEDELKYVLFIDEENYLAGQIGIQRTAIIILAVSIVLGIIISYYMTKYKYKPVEKVVSVSRAITPAHVFASNDNELEQIRRAIEFIYEQKEQTSAVLEKHNIHIKDNAIKMLLDGSIRYQEMTPYVRSLIHIDPNAVYTVAIMDVDSRDHVLCEVEGVRKCVPNARHIVFKGGRIIIIIEEKAKDVLAQLRKQSLAKAWNGTAAVGADGVGAAGIQSSYAQALLGLSRKILPGMPKVIPPLNSKDAGAITISAESEIRLEGYIQSGNAEKALAMLEELTQEHGVNNPNDFSFKTYLFNISNTIIRSAEGVFSDEMIIKMLDGFGAAFQEEDYQRISKAQGDAICYVAEAYKQKMGSANKPPERKPYQAHRQQDIRFPAFLGYDRRNDEPKLCILKTLF